MKHTWTLLVFPAQRRVWGLPRALVIPGIICILYMAQSCSDPLTVFLFYVRPERELSHDSK